MIKNILHSCGKCESMTDSRLHQCVTLQPAARVRISSATGTQMLLDYWPLLVGVAQAGNCLASSSGKNKENKCIKQINPKLLPSDRCIYRAQRHNLFTLKVIYCSHFTSRKVQRFSPIFYWVKKIRSPSRQNGTPGNLKLRASTTHLLWKSKNRKHFDCILTTN